MAFSMQTGRNWQAAGKRFSCFGPDKSSTFITITTDVQ